MMRLRIRVEGVVQGVGFRPFIHLLAERHNLKGWVLNSPRGVLIEVEGEATEDFVEDLKREPPPLATLEKVETEELEPCGYEGFEIRASESNEEPITLIPSDVGTCPDCLREMQDPVDRRYRYPFVNCTHCGPRFTIIEQLPYDRPHTTMKTFPLCPDCAREYADIHNRRYHAQPVACVRCGPSLRLLEPGRGHAPPHEGEEALQRAQQLLKEGKLLAIKGLGGFHLACDATNDESVRRLRASKGRPAKALAIMVPDLYRAYELGILSPRAEEIIQGNRRPVILVPKREGTPLSPSIAPDNNFLGIMLPYTPLHHLLLEGFLALVMTSANESEEPIVSTDGEALSLLSHVADAFLTHDRPIAQKLDDSVLALRKERPFVIRRARGYAPSPFRLETAVPSILAVGAELKNTFVLSKGHHCFLSHHIGDLVNWETFEHFKASLSHLKALYAAEPEIIAHDLHPQYLTTRYANSLPNEVKIGVQHHHAHIVSVLFEHGEREPVIGVACDGTGFGTDGAIWGMEFLKADWEAFERLGHLVYMPMPGGEQAIHFPWRMAMSYLLTALGEKGALRWGHKVWPDIQAEEFTVLIAQLRRGFLSPLTSSAGRLFDSISALLVARTRVSYEGQAAILLEREAERARTPYPLSLPLIEGDPFQLDSISLVSSLIEALDRGMDRRELALGFHLAFARAIVEACRKIREREALEKVALSGGVFQNHLLAGLVSEGLEQEGFRLLWPEEVPTNDGGISLGQAAVAYAQLERKCA